MSSKIIPIFLIILLASILLYFTVFYRPPKEKYFPLLEQIPELKELDKFQLRDFWYENTCEIRENKSVISFAHIQKNNNDYQISCEKGFLYYQTNFVIPLGLPTYFGYIKTCDQQTAILIDKAVREKYNCIWPLQNPIPENLTDYYVFSLGCNWLSNNGATEFLTINPSRMSPVHQCLQKIVKPSNEMSYTCCKSFVFGVIDLKNNKLYLSTYPKIALSPK
jgi:hypothetical protein